MWNWDGWLVFSSQVIDNWGGRLAIVVDTFGRVYQEVVTSSVDDVLIIYDNDFSMLNCITSENQA